MLPLRFRTNVREILVVFRVELRVLLAQQPLLLGVSGSRTHESLHGKVRVRGFRLIANSIQILSGVKNMC